MRKLLQQIKRAEGGKTMRDLRGRTQARLGQRTGISAKQKPRDLLRIMVFGCGFIVTVCAPFSIKRPTSAAQTSLLARIQQSAFAQFSTADALLAEGTL
jgi:hypothetical protein